MADRATKCNTNLQARITFFFKQAIWTIKVSVLVSRGQQHANSPWNGRWLVPLEAASPYHTIAAAVEPMIQVCRHSKKVRKDIAIATASCYST